MKSLHLFGVNDVETRLCAVEVVAHREQDAIILICSLWVGNETHLLTKGLLGSPCGSDATELVIVLDKRPAKILIELLGGPNVGQVGVLGLLTLQDFIILRQVDASLVDGEEIFDIDCAFFKIKGEPVIS